MYVPPEALSAVCQQCSEGGCSLDLGGLAKSVDLIDLNQLKAKLRVSGSISDCAILWKNKQIFSIVELKGGQAKFPVAKVVEQIQLSLNLMDSIAADQHIHDFYPILMYRGPDPTRALNGKLVTFRGTPRRIIPRKCGEKLNSIRVR